MSHTDAWRTVIFLPPPELPDHDVDADQEDQQP